MTLGNQHDEVNRATDRRPGTAGGRAHDFPGNDTLVAVAAEGALASLPATARAPAPDVANAEQRPRAHGGAGSDPAPEHDVSPVRPGATPPDVPEQLADGTSASDGGDAMDLTRSCRFVSPRFLELYKECLAALREGRTPPGVDEDIPGEPCSDAINSFASPPALLHELALDGPVTPAEVPTGCISYVSHAPSGGSDRRDVLSETPSQDRREVDKS